MKKRIFYSITGVTLIALCVFSLLMSFSMYNQIFKSEKSSIKQEYQLIKKSLEKEKGFYDFSNIFTQSRITLIAKDGEVLFDNFHDASQMDNHCMRSEILALKDHESSEATRLSDTLGKQTYYYAEYLDEEYILRLSITIDSVYGIVYKMIPIMILIVFVIIGLSVFISQYLTNKIIAPLYDIDQPIYEELDLFYAKIKAQKRKIKKHKTKLQQKQKEFDVLTQNIGDGFILLNANSEVISINKKAQQLFDLQDRELLNKEVMVVEHSNAFLQAITSAYKGKKSLVQIAIGERDFVFHISPVCPEKKVVGVVIIIDDNTEKAKVEKIRKEFSANVSHELKTPLTSILGYAELVKTGFAKEEDIPSFCDKIHSEATNLLELIEDIIKISRLDEDIHGFTKETISLKTMIEDIIERLNYPITEKNITLKKSIDDVKFEGIKRVLDETFFNVIENAVKYNTNDGLIRISVSEDEKNTIIKVKDTGIGIPQDSIDRIFERFYRVDKSHSSTVKGTGLGLSIVKHAVQLHKGKIDVKSEVGKGTKITISLPK